MMIKGEDERSVCSLIPTIEDHFVASCSISRLLARAIGGYISLN